jgi:hypothetical protein
MTISFCVVSQQQQPKSERIFVKLNLIDFDRTAAQVLNGENNKRMANNSENDRLLLLLNFNYNLMKLADRELSKLIRANKIIKPDLVTVLNMKNVIAKVDKYSSFIEPTQTSIIF